MSLPPQASFQIPEETQRVAQAAFPKGTLCLRIADALGAIYQNQAFAPLFPIRGQPAEAPARLALATVLQFVEGLSDRWCYPSNAGEQTSICNTLNQQRSFTTYAGQSITWISLPIFLRAPAGRQRFKVLGALNAITHELVTVTNDTYITATEVCALLPQLAALTLGVPLTGVLDNARSHRWAQVGTLAASLPSELCLLPPYAPNLNLIERLEQCVKKPYWYSPYYADFPTFKTALVQCLAQTHITHRTALASLLTLRFQLFAKAQFMPA